MRQQQRQHRHRPNPVTAPPTQRSINRETRAATNTRYRPVERAEGAELRASKQREKQVGNWWQNYQNIVAQGRAETAAAYQAAGAQTQGFIDQASARDSENTARLQTEAAQSAAMRGAEPSSEAANREAAAQAQRNYLAANVGAKTAAVGANQFAYLTNEKRIGAGQGIASRREEQRRQRSIEGDRKNTRSDRGEYATVKRGELKKEARDYAIQRRATALEGRKANAEERERRNSNRRANEEQRNQNEAQRNANQEQHNQNEAAQKGGSGGLTPSEKQGIKQGHHNAMSAARTAIKLTGWPKTAKQWAQLEQAVASQSEISPAEAAWAVKRLKHRHHKNTPPKIPSVSPFA